MNPSPVPASGEVMRCIRIPLEGSNRCDSKLLHPASDRSWLAGVLLGVPARIAPRILLSVRRLRRRTFLAH